MASKDVDGQDGAQPEMDAAPSDVGPAGVRKKVAELLPLVAALLKRHEALLQGGDDLQESERIRRDTLLLLRPLGQAFASCRTWHPSELGSLYDQLGKVVDTCRPTDEDGNPLYREFEVRPILDEAYARLSEADRVLRVLPDKPAGQDLAAPPPENLPGVPAPTPAPVTAPEGEAATDTTVDQPPSETGGIIAAGAEAKRKPGRKRGPKPARDHRKVKEIVDALSKARSGDWWEEKNLIELAARLDKAKILPPKQWLTRELVSRSWERGVSNYPRLVVLAVEESLKAASVSLTATAPDATHEPLADSD